MALLFYTFMFGPSSPVYQSGSVRGGAGSRLLTHPSPHNPSYVPSGWGGDMLKNRVFFTFMFVEMVSWFWIWITLREERFALVQRVRRSAERDD